MRLFIKEKKTNKIIIEMRIEENDFSNVMSMLENNYSPDKYEFIINNLETDKKEEFGKISDGLKSILPSISLFLIPFINIILIVSVFFVNSIIYKIAAIVCSMIMIILAIILLRRK